VIASRRRFVPGDGHVADGGKLKCLLWG